MNLQEVKLKFLQSQRANMADEANQNEQEDVEMTTWLKSIKLDCYSKNFTVKEYKCMEQLKAMTPTDVPQLIIDAEIILGGASTEIKISYQDFAKFII